MNNVALTGRMGNDCNLKYLSDGKPVGTFSLAVSRDWKNKDGERETDWIKVVVWQQQAEFCSNFLGKGRLVGVRGRFQTRAWVDPDGTKHSAIEIVADHVEGLDKPKESAEAPRASSGPAEELPPAIAETTAFEDPFADE
jgi:single-strand DNA-binding protein